MIKEFFKSTFRTLGRVFAYVVLGILAYFILTWFGITNVKAEEFNNNAYMNYTLTNRSSTLSTGTLPINNLSANNNNGFDFYLHYMNYTAYTDHYYDITLVVDHNSNGQALMYTNWTQQINGCNIYIESSYNQSSTGCRIDGYTDSRVIISTSNLHATDINNRITFQFYVNGGGSRLVDFNVTGYTLYITAKEDTSVSSQDVNNSTTAIINNQNQNTTIINNSLTDINNSLTDESPADFGILQDISNYMPSNAPLTNVITLPLTILALEINSLNGSCSSWSINMGSLFNNYILTIPCINPGNYLTGFSWQGYDLWNLIDLMFCMFMGYEILMLIISAWEDITSLEDTFDGLYQPKHKGYQTKHNGERLD